MIPRRLSSHSRWISRLPEFARRALHVDQMELDSALSQMYSLCWRPSLVSKMSRARKMTKNHYHRDDPAFIVLQVLAIIIVVVAYGLALKGGPFQILFNVLFDVSLNYFLTGIIMATVTWVFVNRFLMSAGLHETRREIDWQYAFDIHCNGFFPYFLWTKVVQFILLPLLLQSTFTARFVSNLLHTVGCVLYMYIVFLGYLDLPSITQQQRLAYPIPIIVIFMLFVTLFTNLNLTQWNLSLTWHA